MKVREIIKKTGIIKTTKDETLGTILNNLSSSHDAAFVFENENFKKYLGVISPYYAVIKSSYPPETKVEKVIFHAPKLALDDPLEKAARLMIESKVHYLPVLDNSGTFLGIVTARRIMRRLLQTKKLDIPVTEVLSRKKPLITISERSKIEEALQLFREQKVSKLVVVDSHKHLRGVLSFYDLIPLTFFPKERMSLGDRAGNKEKMNGGPVKNLMKTFVLSLSTNATLKEAAEMILEKGIGSVVILDPQNRPVGIITTRDILSTLQQGPLELGFSEVEVKNLKEKHIPYVKLFVERLLDKAKKRGYSVFVWIEEKKHGGVIKIKVRLDTGKEVKYISREDKNIKKVITDIDTALEEYF